MNVKLEKCSESGYLTGSQIRPRIGVRAAALLGQGRELRSAPCPELQPEEKRKIDVCLQHSDILK